MTRRSGIRAWAGLLLAILGGRAAPGAEPPLPAPGRVVPRVQCRTAPDQSYALYLPAGYHPDRKWPLLLAFDPAGRGQVPVERFQAAAERYGYVVAGSNNARNGPWGPVTTAVDALWADLMSRLAIDPARVYATGFSGGARVSCALALSRAPGPLAGVVACGAGLPVQQGNPREIDFALFGTVGARDFNYQELRALDRQSAARGLPHRLEVFDGGHEWPPPELCGRALAWFDLLAMKAGRRDRDEALLSAWFADDQARADTLAGAGQVTEAVRLLEESLTDFEGLRDLAPVKQRAAELRGMPDFKRLQSMEKREVKEEEAFRAKLAGVARRIREAAGILPDPDKVIRELGLPGLLAELDRKRGTGGEPSLLRRINLALAHFAESTDTFLRNQDYRQAVLCQECVVRIRPDSAPARYNLACALARAGQAAPALASLEAALDRGFSDRDLLASDPDLASLRGLPEFQKLAERMEGQAKPPAPTP